MRWVVVLLAFATLLAFARWDLERVSPSVIPEVSPASMLFAGEGIPSLLVAIPNPWAATMALHVREIIGNGWARDLTPRDLDHAHLLFKPDFKCPTPCTPERVMDGTAAILYHTAEQAGRWADEAKCGIPVDERTHRSIVGWSDGRVQPIAELFWNLRHNLIAYDSNGTVFDEEARRLRPDLFGDTDRMDVTAEFGENPLTCHLSSQLDIIQSSKGRFALSDGREYDAFLVCLSPKGTLR